MQPDPWGAPVVLRTESGNGNGNGNGKQAGDRPPNVALTRERPRGRPIEAARSLLQFASMTRAVYEVLPAGKTWVIRMAGDSQSELAETKSEAIERAQELGRHYDEWTVRVMTERGTLETEITKSAPPP